MKNVLLFLFAIISCQYSFGQEVTVDDLKELRVPSIWNEKTQDAAYEARNSSLLKKWYVPGQVTRLQFIEKGVYIQFMANGTFQLHAKEKDWSVHYTHEYILPGRWKRVHDQLTLTYNFNQIRFLDKFNGLSMRQKDNVIKSQRKYREHEPFTWTCHILRMDDCLILDDFYYLSTHFTVYTHLKHDELCFVSKEYIINKKNAEKKEAEEAKKKAEETKKAEEEAKKAEEAVKEANNLNEKAYEYARKGNFNDAIATINKAINLCPKDPNYYDSKGEILYNKGDKDGAKGMWDKVISLDPSAHRNRPFCVPNGRRGILDPQDNMNAHRANIFGLDFDQTESLWNMGYKNGGNLRL